MSLFIGFVLSSITEQYMSEVFYDTFGANVYISFSKDRTNQYGTTYKSANIEVVNTTRNLDQFISEIHKYGSNQFNHTKTDMWKVQLKTDQEPVLVKVPPRIVF